ETDAVSLTHEEGVEDIAHDLLVVDDQNGSVTIHQLCPSPREARAPELRGRSLRHRLRVASCADASGSDRVKRVPLPGMLSQAIVPSCSCTIPYVMDSPRPVPLPISLVVKNGS